MMASQQQHQNQQGAYTAETMTTAAASSSTGGGDCPRCSELENRIQELQRQLTMGRNYSHEQQTAHVALIQQMQTEHRKELQILNQQHRKEVKDALGVASIATLSIESTASIAKVALESSDNCGARMERVVANAFTVVRDIVGNQQQQGSTRSYYPNSHGGYAYPYHQAPYYYFYGPSTHGVANTAEPNGQQQAPVAMSRPRPSPSGNQQQQQQEGSTTAGFQNVATVTGRQQQQQEGNTGRHLLNTNPASSSVTNGDSIAGTAGAYFVFGGPPSQQQNFGLVDNGGDVTNEQSQQQQQQQQLAGNGKHPVDARGTADTAQQQQQQQPGNGLPPVGPSDRGEGNHH